MAMGKDSKAIFRKVSLERLSSPEQLDALLEITTPKAWLALAGLLAIVVTAVVWALKGTVPTRVQGVCILVRKTGLTSVNTLAGGQLSRLLVKTGDAVSKGQVVAHLELPELRTELGNLTAELGALESQHRQLNRFGSEDRRLQGEVLEQQRSIAHSQIEVARERTQLLGNKLRTQSKLLEEGLITDQVVQGTRDALLVTRAEMERARSTLKELNVRRTEVAQQLKKSNADRGIRIAELRRRIGDLEDRIKRYSLVVALQPGRVIETRVAVGTLVPAGTSVVMLEMAEQHGGGMRAVVYVSGADGKKVRPKMTAEVSPSTVKREEYGALRGNVAWVSEFPATSQAIIAELGNQELAATFLKSVDTPIELHADIRTSTKTDSGYEWTSPKGPPDRIQPGTLCTASITVRERPPISLVLPLIREKLQL